MIRAAFMFIDHDGKLYVSSGYDGDMGPRMGGSEKAWEMLRGVKLFAQFLVFLKEFSDFFYVETYGVRSTSPDVDWHQMLTQVRDITADMTKAGFYGSVDPDTGLLRLRLSGVYKLDAASEWLYVVNGMHQAIMLETQEEEVPVFVMPPGTAARFYYGKPYEADGESDALYQAAQLARWSRWQVDTEDEDVENKGETT